MTSPSPLACALFIIAAFVLAGLVHSAWLRAPLSRRLAFPLDGGARLRGRRVFGDNKTVRGFIVMVPAAAISFATLSFLLGALLPDAAESLWPLSTAGYAILGAWGGLGFMLGELPNSFVKRQLDVPPGEAPAGRLPQVVSFLIDRFDSIVGMLVAVSLAAPTPWLTWLYVLGLGPAIHWSFSVLLYRIGVKPRPA